MNSKKYSSLISETASSILHGCPNISAKPGTRIGRMYSL
jgi:hypothetical protein